MTATERAGTADTDPRKETFTEAELAAVVDEAKKSGMNVAAHAHGNEGATAAINAGVRSIEHGTFLNNETLALMKSKKIYLVPTFSFWEEAATRPVFKDNAVLSERLKTLPAQLNEAVTRAHTMGLAIVAGTDITYLNPGISIFNEAILLQKASLTSMEIIQAMTARAAECLKIEKHTGSIKKNMDADLVIIDGNPLEDLNALKEIKMVVNDGKIVINKSK